MNREITIGKKIVLLLASSMTVMAGAIVSPALVEIGHAFADVKDARFLVPLLLTLPALFVQGERDPLGNRAEVETYPLSEAIRFHWCPDGDHDLTPRKRSGHSQEDNWDRAMDAVSRFLKAL